MNFSKRLAAGFATTCVLLLLTACGGGGGGSAPPPPVTMPPDSMTPVVPTPVAPSPVSNVRATRVGDVVNLTWNPSTMAGGAGQRVMYRIEVSVDGGTFTVLSGGNAVTGTTFTDTATYPPGATVRYRITAFNSAGENPTPQTPAQPISIPAIQPGPVTSVTAMRNADPATDAVTLRWTAPTNDGGAAVTYRIEVSINNGAFMTLSGGVGLTATTFTDTTNYPDGATVRYRVFAVNPIGDSPAPASLASVSIPIEMKQCSDGTMIPVSQTCPPPPPQTMCPGGLTPVGGACPMSSIWQVQDVLHVPRPDAPMTTMVLAWKQPANVPPNMTLDFAIEYSTDDGASYTVFPNPSLSVSDDMGVIGTYSFVHPLPIPAGGTQPANLKYRITAITPAGASAPFETSVPNPRTRIFCDDGQVLPLTGTCSVAAARPNVAINNLLLTRDTNSNVTLTWNPPRANTPNRYVIEVSVNGGGFTRVVENFISFDNDITYIHRNAPSGDLRYRITPNQLYGNFIDTAAHIGPQTLGILNFITIADSEIPVDGNGTPDNYFQDGCDPSTEECFIVECDSGIGDTAICVRDRRQRNVKVSGSTFYPNGLTIGFRDIWGSHTHPQFFSPNPPQDVRDAWRQGWTGAGVKLLLIDAFGGVNDMGVADFERISVSNNIGVHGYAVALSALEIAPRVDLRLMESGLTTSGGGTNRDYRETHYSPGDSYAVNDDPDQKIDVINLSQGLRGPPRLFPRLPNAQELADILTLQYTRELFNDLSGGLAYPDPSPNPAIPPILGRNSFVYLTNTADAVIVKSAGNNGDTTEAAHQLDNYAMLTHVDLSRRVLFVGALDGYGRVSLTNENGNTVRIGARLAGYSTKAGTFAAMQERFLVEHGGSPVTNPTFLCNAGDTPGNCEQRQSFADDSSITRGTSFAAPRVAGYAALVRHKFPNLSGAQTTKILLDTATYEGLVCEIATNPNCMVENFGQGRVDILDALSPIGKLE